MVSQSVLSVAHAFRNVSNQVVSLDLWWHGRATIGLTVFRDVMFSHVGPKKIISEVTKGHLPLAQNMDPPRKKREYVIFRGFARVFYSNRTPEKERETLNQRTLLGYVRFSAPLAPSQVQDLWKTNMSDFSARLRKNATRVDWPQTQKVPC